jgi:hypothetical protein
MLALARKSEESMMKSLKPEKGTGKPLVSKRQ